MEYKEEDFLQLSGIQHFLFCPRQWALIHIEQQWRENVLTVSGELLHENAHDNSFIESRGEMLVYRGMRIYSNVLGITGQCDVVEFHRTSEGITLSGRNGLWSPYLVEYKNGIPKDEAYDSAQLCLQAICLESMFCCDITEGALFYGKTKHREIIRFTKELRKLVIDAVEEMHALYEKGYTPSPKLSKTCNSCSLFDICMPKLKEHKSVQRYLKTNICENF